MTEFHSNDGPCPEIPDNLTLAQFMLDIQHPTRPERPLGVPWFVEDATGRSISGEEVRARVFALANAFKIRWNIGENDVVCIFSPNHVDYFVVVWALHRLGAVATLANPSYTADELIYQLEKTQACLLLSAVDSLEVAQSAAKSFGISQDRILTFDNTDPNGKQHDPSTSLNDLVREGMSRERVFDEKMFVPGEAKERIAFLCFSSGTTGKPKAVMLSHYCIIANLIQMAAQNKLNDPSDTRPFEKRRMRPGDSTLGVLPSYHIYGMNGCALLLIYAAMSVVVVPKFNFVSFLEGVQKYRITHLYIAPPHAVLLCKSPLTKNYDLSHVRYVLSGAAPLSAELVQNLITILPNAEIGQGYGLTETSPAVTMFPLHQRIGSLGSVGQLIPGTIARVIKDDGSLAGYDEPGELIIKTPSLAMGYLNDEVATKEAFVDGWFHTGDQVIFKPNGDMFIIDRLKEIFKVRGFQVAPAELEGFLLTHPDIVDTCVVGVPDDYSGEIPLAFVVLNEKVSKGIRDDPQEIQRVKDSITKYVADNKIYYKRLTGGVEIVDAIPKNGAGKLLRRVLRETAKKLRNEKTSLQTKL